MKNSFTLLIPKLELQIFIDGDMLSFQVMSATQRSLIEGATVSFFTSAISCHPENQHLFANVLCDVIRAQIPRPNSKLNFTAHKILNREKRILAL